MNIADGLRTHSRRVQQRYLFWSYPTVTKQAPIEAPTALNSYRQASHYIASLSVEAVSYSKCNGPRKTYAEISYAWAELWSS